MCTINVGCAAVFRPVLCSLPFVPKADGSPTGAWSPPGGLSKNV
jgi:hypothetical protein